MQYQFSWENHGSDFFGHLEVGLHLHILDVQLQYHYKQTPELKKKYNIQLTYINNLNFNKYRYSYRNWWLNVYRKFLFSISCAFILNKSLCQIIILKTTCLDCKIYLTYVSSLAKFVLNRSKSSCIGSCHWNLQTWFKIYKKMWKNSLSLLVFQLISKIRGKLIP